MLKPGGRFVFAGEPTTVGNFYARWLGRATWEATTTSPSCRSWPTGVVRRRSSTSPPAPPRSRPSSTCTPSIPPTSRTWRSRRAPTEVQAATEEFAAALLGWPVRTFEAAVPPEKLGWGWGQVRVRWLEDAELGRREGPPARRAAGLLLQRDDHRREARRTGEVVGYDVHPGGRAVPAASDGRHRRPRGGGSARTVRRVRAWPTSAGRVRVSATAPALLVETVLLRRRARRRNSTAPRTGCSPTTRCSRRRRRWSRAIVPTRLAGRAVHDVTCSVGAELAALVGVARDRDRQRPRPGAPGDGAAQRARRDGRPRRRARAVHPRHRRARRSGAAVGRQAHARPGRAAAAAAGSARRVPRTRPRR